MRSTRQRLSRTCTLRRKEILPPPPSSHPVCLRPARMWSGRGSWRPGGARHCTNDLDARGRVCSARPGRWQVGWEHSAHRDARAGASGEGPSRSRSAPAGGIALTRTVWSHLMPPANPPMRAALAERGADGSDGPIGRRTRGRRSVSDAGCLEDVEKVWTARRFSATGGS
jgi:hypothetical protein